MVDPYSDDNVRRWAYSNEDCIDDSMQDEDLILGGLSLSVLLPLVDDPKCPKADTLLQCLDYRHMHKVLRGDRHDLADVRDAADRAQHCTRTEVKRWVDMLRRRLRYRTGEGPVSREAAIQMGHDLLNGLARNCEISLSQETPTSWIVQLSVPPLHEYRELLTISKQTGQFEWEYRFEAS